MAQQGPVRLWPTAQGAIPGGYKHTQPPERLTKGVSAPVPPVFCATPAWAGNSSSLSRRCCAIKPLHEVDETNVVEVNAHVHGSGKRVVVFVCASCFVQSLNREGGWSFRLRYVRAKTTCGLTGFVFPSISAKIPAVTITNPHDIGDDAVTVCGDAFVRAYAPLFSAAGVTSAAALKAKFDISDTKVEAGACAKFFSGLESRIAALMPPPPPPVAPAPAPAAPPVIEIPSSDDDEEAPAPAPATIDLTAEDDEAPEVGAKRTAADAGFN